VKTYHFNLKRYERMMLRRYPKMARETFGFHTLPRKQRNALWNELLEKGIAAFGRIGRGRNADVGAWRKRRQRLGLQVFWKRGSRRARLPALPSCHM
jgi:hypothetical protein